MSALASPWPQRAWLIGALIPIRTFLHTGLFIAAHDAMHGSLIPARPTWNPRLGRALLLLYACLPYRRCALLHRRHHRHHGTSSDPDFHPCGSRPLPWYARFMGRYVGGRQVGALAAILMAATLLLHPVLGPAAGPVLLALWLLPIVLSSWQLFLFGTYLPHRGAPEVRSLALPWGLSLLSCYHFGFHREHHRDPAIPWYLLPSAARSRSDARSAPQCPRRP